MDFLLFQEYQDSPKITTLNTTQNPAADLATDLAAVATTSVGNATTSVVTVGNEGNNASNNGPNTPFSTTATTATTAAFGDPFGLGGGMRGGLGIDQPSFTKEVHIRIFKRNGRKCCTTVELEALPDLDIKPFIKKCAKKFCCNGSHNKKENLLKFSGDVREGLAELLIEMGQATKDAIKIHGF